MATLPLSLKHRSTNGGLPSSIGDVFGAGNEIRTRDPNLGKVVLYQLSYSRRIEGYCKNGRFAVKRFIRRTATCSPDSQGSAACDLPSSAHIGRLPPVFPAVITGHAARR